MSGIAADSLTPWARASVTRQPGYALPQACYTDPAIFEREMERLILPHWHCVGHVSQLREPGDYFTVEIAGESVIVARGQDGEVRGLVNSCRHRGARVCTEAAGSARNFTCPYHAWSYGLDGALRAARHLPETVDRGALGLKTLPVRVIEGLVFLTFAAEPLGLDHVVEVLGSSARAYGWNDARIAHRETYRVTANWKLAVENYMECYHCQPAHPEYSRGHVFARPSADNREIDDRLRARTARLGVEIGEIDRWADRAAPGQEGADCARSALYDGTVSGSQDGGPVAPLMGSFSDYDGGVTFIDIGPTSTFLAYPDHGLIYRFIPVSVAVTDMEVIWLVRGDAVEGRDYDIERLTWLWRVTSLADKRIIELNQAGINSRYYEPGPYVPMERGTGRFVDWCLKEIV
jgi:Rieske 2Fe-2S family protein